MLASICIISILVLKVQFIIARKCAYFPQYPDLSKITYKTCSADSSCYEGYTSNASLACQTYSPMWWLSFIVILAVVFLVIALVLICCLVRKLKELKKEEALRGPPGYANNVNPYGTKSYEINFQNNDIGSPNYMPGYSRTATTIDLKDPNTILPVLPASHLAGDEAPPESVDFTTFSRTATTIDLKDSNSILPVLPASHFTEDDNKQPRNNPFSSFTKQATTIELRGESDTLTPVLAATHIGDSGGNMKF